MKIFIILASPPILFVLFSLRNIKMNHLVFKILR